MALLPILSSIDFEHCCGTLKTTHQLSPIFLCLNTHYLMLRAAPASIDVAKDRINMVTVYAHLCKRTSLFPNP